MMIFVPRHFWLSVGRRFIGFQFTVFITGFQFDDYSFYRNLSASVSPEVGRLSVHFAPEFEQFDGTLKYDPKPRENIEIPVKNRSY